jgi:hypothetical protein
MACTGKARNAMTVRISARTVIDFPLFKKGTYIHCFNSDVAGNVGRNGIREGEAEKSLIIEAPL